MSADALLFGLVLAGVLAVCGPLALRGWRQGQARRAWLELTPRLELTLTEEGDPRLLSGRYQGHSVEVLLAPDGTAQMRMKVQADLPPGLHLSRQEAGPHRLQLRGMRDIQVGDAALDEAFLIQGSNPAAVIRLLREPGVRDTLLALVAGNPRAVLTGNEVVAPMGYPVREEPCRHALRALAQVASTLERAAGQHAQLAASAREQARSERPATAARTQAPAEPAKTPVDKARSDREIRDEYARRTSLYSLIGQLPAFVGCLMLMFSGRKGFLESSGFPWGMVGFGLFVGGMVGTMYGNLKLLRCPACDESLVPERRSPSGTELLNTEVRRRGSRYSDALSLVACPSCKTRLR